MSQRVGVVTWLGLLAVAAGAAVLSFTSLMDLAIVCGTHRNLAWLFPVALDAAAVVATRVWLAKVSGEVVVEARRIAVGTLVLSVLGNATDHYLRAYQVVPPWWLVAVVAMVPPVVLVTTVHLVAAMVRNRQMPTAEVDQQKQADVDNVHISPGDDLVAVRSSEEQQADNQDPVVDQPTEQPSTDQPAVDLVAKARRFIRSQERQGNTRVGRVAVAKHLGVSDHQARQILSQARKTSRPKLASVGGGE